MIPATVGALLSAMELWEGLRHDVIEQLGPHRALPLLKELDQLPLKSSRALTRLGSYRSRGGSALEIRLQFEQDADQLKQTLLHEVAHFLDHQTRKGKRSYRTPHGAAWQQWMRLLGADLGRGEAPRISQLYRQRMKPVARCERCGEVVLRLRRLARGRRWIHQPCGGSLIPLE